MDEHYKTQMVSLRLSEKYIILIEKAIDKLIKEQDIPVIRSWVIKQSIKIELPILLKRHLD